MSPEELFSLKGKTALISGASSGLGEHFAQVMAAAGARMVVAARRIDRLEDLVSRIRDSGGQASALAMDVTSPESVSEAFQILDAEVGQLDILVNNAGITNSPTRLVTQKEEEWGYLLDVNLKGIWRVGAQAARRMREQGSGVIVNTSSIYGHCTGLGIADYNVSKVAVDQLTRNMALELGRSGVRVNALCPGYFASAINEEQFSKEGGQDYIRGLVPRRLGEYHELDGPLLLLVSAASSFMNGASLVVDGGTLLRPI